MEASMTSPALYRTLAGIAVSLAISFTAAAAPEPPEGPPETAIVAQATSSSSESRDVGVAGELSANQRGVRKAAAESPEALRRYVWRTRMIYNFSYKDFAPKE